MEDAIRKDRPTRRSYIRYDGPICALAASFPGHAERTLVSELRNDKDYTKRSSWLVDNEHDRLSLWCHQILM